MEEPDRLPQILSPSSSGRRSIDSNSPEFEFWMVTNPSLPQPDLLSADELFSDGVLLPLNCINLSSDTTVQELEPSGSDRAPQHEHSAADFSAASALTSSKRWRGIFKKSNSNSCNGDDVSVKEKDNGVKGRKRAEKKNGVGASIGVTAAELNINIWPFSRSRSAGNSGARPRSAAATRKVSSAPCSRSNSAGESKSRKWPSSPGRAGVHLGRSSPLWQVRRGGGGRSSETCFKNGDKNVSKNGGERSRKIPVADGFGASSKARALSLNVPLCVGYRQTLSCRSDENSPISVAAAAASGGAVGGQNSGDISVEGARGSNLFSIRSLFTKKVY